MQCIITPLLIYHVFNVSKRILRFEDVQLFDRFGSVGFLHVFEISLTKAAFI